MTFMKLRKRILGSSRIARVVVVALAFSMIASTAAAAFPEKPVTLIIPMRPGGGADTTARIIGKAMSETLGQPVVCDNRVGASGNIALQTVANAPADGYTILMGISSALTVNPSLYKNMPADVQKDLVPIAMLASAQYMLATHPSIGVKSVKELVAKAKAEPGKLNYSTAGKGTPLHVAGEMFKSMAGLDIAMIPYSGGSAAAKSTLAGETQLIFGSFSSTQKHVQAGKLVAHAVTGPKRSPVAPDLPTMQELGYKGFSVTMWYALMAPVGTPQEAIDKLASAANTALKSPDVVKALKKGGLFVETGSADEVARIIKEDTIRMKKVLSDAGVKPE